MARKTNLDGLIHCDSCGEDYSATYKRCPFCGGRQSGTAPVRQDPDDEDDGYQPGRFRDDDYDRYQDYGSESEFAEAGFTMKENSDDDDLAVADAEPDEFAEDDIFDEED